MVYLISTIAIVGIVGTVYFVVVFLGAKVEVAAAPREEMVWCPTHGAIRKQHMIKFLDSDFCPSCFDAKLRRAEKGLPPQ